MGIVNEIIRGLIVVVEGPVFLLILFYSFNQDVSGEGIKR